MSYVIVGTAGHVDHGKTELVKALTGNDTDRLKEEKERGISIELGFAPLVLEGGQRIGLIDVPGHEKFIKQMLAGIAGMDLVMLIIAADEGIMPQTREHLDIINLLQIKEGIVVVTKKDLVDPEWLELVTEEIQLELSKSVLKDAPLVTVSSLTGEGIPALKEILEAQIKKTEAKLSNGFPRLPIDRVFSITGFGTIVTGTLWSGRIQVGDNMVVLPEGLETRVRSLQVHGESVNEAFAGQRTAANLAGIEVAQIARGSVLVEKGKMEPSHYIDVELQLLPTVPELENRMRVRVHIGTSEILGRVILLNEDKLLPGKSTLAQLQLEEVLVSAKGDKYIIRSYSPVHTIAGGVVIDPKAVKHKRFDDNVLRSIETKLLGSPEELTLEALEKNKNKFVNAKDLIALTSLSGDELELALSELLKKEEIIEICLDNRSFYLAEGDYLKIVADLKVLLKDFHQKYPLRQGYSKEELRSKLFNKLDTRIFNLFLQKLQDKEIIKQQESYVALLDFIPQIGKREKEVLEKLENLYEVNLYQPPSWSEAASNLQLKQEEAQELLRYLIRQEKLVKVAEDIYFTKEAISKAQGIVGEYIEKNGSIELAHVRDLLGSSRKYVLPLLEYFDQIKFTRRKEDHRVLY